MKLYNPFLEHKTMFLKALIPQKKILSKLAENDARMIELGKFQRMNALSW